MQAFPGSWMLDGHVIASRTKRTDESCQGERHKARTLRASARVRHGLSLSPSRHGATRQAGSRIPATEMCNLCTRLFLAPAHGMRSMPLAEITPEFLETEARGESPEGSAKSARAQETRLAP